MSKLRFPVARDDDGSIVPPQLALEGKLYNCPFCDTARLSCRRCKNKQDHYKTVSGTVHTGISCRNLEKGESVSFGVIDIKQLVANAYRANAAKEPGNPEEGKHPGKPRGPAKHVMICSNLKAIAEYNLRNIDDYRLDDGSMLSDHFVAWRNASVVLDDNSVSLRGRILEVEPICCLAQHRTIRCYIKGRTSINGRPITTRLIIDVECADADIFQAIRAKYFVKYMVRGRSEHQDYEEWDYAPRYKRLYVLGVFTVNPRIQCNENKVCKDKRSVCSGDYVNCIGRQTMLLVHPEKQIYAHQNDMADLSWLNGWSEEL